MTHLTGASYAPPPSVRQYPGGKSYHTDDPRALAAYLESQGWRRYPPKSGSETCRLWRSDALIVCYLSGSLAIGGKRAEIAHNELGALLAEPAGEQLALWPEGSAA